MTAGSFSAKRKSLFFLSYTVCKFRKNHQYPCSIWGEGFEPPSDVLETSMLPLHHPHTKAQTTLRRFVTKLLHFFLERLAVNPYFFFAFSAFPLFCPHFFQTLASTASVPLAVTAPVIVVCPPKPFRRFWGWLPADFLCHSVLPFQKNGGRFLGSSVSVASAQGALSPIGLCGVAFRRVTIYRFVYSVRLSEGRDPAAYKH